MTRYFVASQVWLAVTLILRLGRTYERSDPLRYSFFHLGWFEPGAYLFLILGTLGLALVFAVLTVATKARAADSSRTGASPPEATAFETRLQR